MCAIHHKQVEGADSYSAIDVFVAINLDLTYICHMVYLNTKETIIDLV